MRVQLNITAVLSILLLAGGLRAEDGHRLWLRYDQIQDRQLLKQYSLQVGEIVVAGDSPTLTAIRGELHRGLSGLLGQDMSVVTNWKQKSAVMVIASTNSLLMETVGLRQELASLGDEAYLIRSVTKDNRLLTVVASPTEAGALYGAFHFLRLLQTQQNISNLNITEQPKLQRRILDHWDNLDGTVERGYAGKSLWKWSELPGMLDPRYQDYARACASIGLNGVVLNNVNAKPEQLATDNLKKAAKLAEVLRPYGIRVYLTANFASPKKLGGLWTANPTDPKARRWWKDKVDEIYSLIPDFGGFLMKANSEGQPGPQDYKLTHADGANMIAEALAPHDGVVMWRAFVYNSSKVDKDRAKRAYLEFMPLDGKFATNVFVQVKNGPIDFQPREPFHPLFGALKKTSVMAECEITQENMGHSTDIVFLAPMWKELFQSDTFANGRGTTVMDTLEASPLTGIAGVSNAGDDTNWCGHDFAQANWYAFGRLAWGSNLSSDQIAEEWTRMTWGSDAKVVSTVEAMLRGSWEACVNYEMPLGLHHIMEGGGHYDPKPGTLSRNTPEYSGWYYHKADVKGIGFDRTATGSDAVGQYAPEVAARFANLEACPPELFLWFHHVSWDYRLKTGHTVWEELCSRYQAGVDYVKEMQVQWESLRGKVDVDRFESVQTKLEAQLRHATNWRDVCLRYFQTVNHKQGLKLLADETQPKN
ncbi:MAG: alpha-glucuronidase [Pedosphaera sp.]|nr:alpha-glucuronidase [Pedosphaera sp.]